MTAQTATPDAELKALHDFAVELAGRSVATIAAGRPAPEAAQTKSDLADWVTPFDRAVERAAREAIASRYPDHDVVGEEYGAMPTSGRPRITWYLDPIDGTTNFVHGLPWACFSLAGFDASGVAVGVVADAYRGEVFSAMRGGGAYLNAAPVRCRPAETLAGEIVLTEWSGGRPWPGMYPVLTAISDGYGASRIMGSCALALACVGAGRSAAALLPGRYNLWDVAAGALIAREGGALVYGRGGVHDGVPDDGILAATPGTADTVWRLWQAAARSEAGGV